MASKRTPKKKGKKSQDLVKNDKDEKYDILTEEPKDETSGISSLQEGSHEDARKVSTNQIEDTIASAENSGVGLGRLNSSSRLSTSTEMSEDGDIVSLIVPETSQKIVHCLVGKDLFVDKTWCMVKKADVLEDIAIEDSNSPFFNLTQKILHVPAEFQLADCMTKPLHKPRLTTLWRAVGLNQ